MAAERVINEDETVVLIPATTVLGVPNAITATGLTPYSALTAAVINTYASVTSVGSGAVSGGNVTCALLADDFTLGWTDSEEDDEKSLCEPGNSIDLTGMNFDAEMAGFRDATSQALPIANKAQDSVHELWRRLTFAPDVPYLVVHRIGFPSTQAFAVGQKIDVYFIETDVPVDVHEDGAKQKTSQSFISKSDGVDEYTIAA